jgi:hypothetical protein
LAYQDRIFANGADTYSARNATLCVRNLVARSQSPVHEPRVGISTPKFSNNHSDFRHSLGRLGSISPQSDDRAPPRASLALNANRPQFTVPLMLAYSSRHRPFPLWYSGCIPLERATHCVASAAAISTFPVQLVPCVDSLSYPGATVPAKPELGEKFPGADAKLSNRTVTQCCQSVVVAYKSSRQSLPISARPKRPTFRYYRAKIVGPRVASPLYRNLRIVL